jgi:hypothetical protein
MTVPLGLKVHAAAEVVPPVEVLVLVNPLLPELKLADNKVLVAGDDVAVKLIELPKQTVAEEIAAVILGARYPNVTFTLEPAVQLPSVMDHNKE